MIKSYFRRKFSMPKNDFMLVSDKMKLSPPPTFPEKVRKKVRKFHLSETNIKFYFWH